MSVCCDYCVLSGRGLCDALITRPEESYRLWRVVVCDLETLRMSRPRPALGRSATGGGRMLYFQVLLKDYTSRSIYLPWLTTPGATDTPGAALRCFGSNMNCDFCLDLTRPCVLASKCRYLPWRSTEQWVKP